jgi:branched-chain amino acid transport system permease protein
MNLGRWLGALAAVWALQWLVAGHVDPYLLGVAIYAGINVMLAVSLNLVNGFTGQFSMGHAGFMSVGAYAAAYLTTLVQTAHPEWLAVAGLRAPVFVAALAAGGAAAAVVGFAVGLPSLRLKGDYLAIVTLGSISTPSEERAG